MAFHLWADRRCIESLHGIPIVARWRNRRVAGTVASLHHVRVQERRQGPPRSEISEAVRLKLICFWQDLGSHSFDWLPLVSSIEIGRRHFQFDSLLVNRDVPGAMCRCAPVSRTPDLRPDLARDGKIHHGVLLRNSLARAFIGDSVSTREREAIQFGLSPVGGP